MWGRQKVESYVLLLSSSSSSSTLGGRMGGKEDMDLGQSERSASEAGWSRVVGGEPRSLTAAGFNGCYFLWVVGLCGENKDVHRLR